MKIKIRPMITADKPAITEILRNTPEFKPDEVEVAEELLDCYLEDPKGSGYYVLVADVDLTVLGYICYGPTPMTEGTWDMYWEAVVRERQGQGIGGILMDSAEKEIIKAKGRMAVIETSSTPEYEKTRRFHFNNGYKLVCQIPDFYSPGDDKLILVKRFDG